MSTPADVPSEKRHKFGKRVLLAVIVLCLVAGIVCNYWPGEGHITISRETTYVLGPVNPDGTVNYLAALNEGLSKGVTAENNAAPLLIRALGPEILDDSVRDKQLELLGIASLWHEGRYYVSLGDYLEQTAPQSPAADALMGMIEDKYDDLVAMLCRTPWSSADHPAIAAWLEASEKPLALVAQATRRPRYYLPLICPSDPPSVIASPIQSFHLIMDLHRALTMRAMLKLHAGNGRAATADVLTIHRLARLMGQGPHLISVLIAIVAEDTACDATIAVAASGKLSAAEAKALMTELEALGPASDLAAAIDKSERFNALDCVMVLSHSKNPVHALDSFGGAQSSRRGAVTDAVNWDTMLRTINRLYDAIVTVQTSADPAEIAKAEAEHKTIMGRAAFHGHPVKIFFCRFGGRAATGLRTRVLTGKIVSIIVPVVGRMFDIEREVRMKLKLARLSLALAAFKAEKGRFPAKLAELAPAYMKTIPMDSFTNKPLIYKRAGKGYVLYSLGANMTDDGGQEDENAGKDDIVVRVK